MKVIKIGENGYFLDLDDALDRFRFKAKHYTGAWLYARIGPNCHGNWDLWWETDSYSATSSDLIQDTLCPCTGIKDSDGKLIYENDILLVQKPTDGQLVYENGTFSVDKPEEETETLTVKYDEDEHCIIVKSDKLKWYWGSRFFRCARVYNWNIKVIGNVFDEESKDD